MAERLFSSPSTIPQTAGSISGGSGGTAVPNPLPVIGTFFPPTQPISGDISVSNFPATQPVSGTFWPVTQPISGSVSVSNLPATQAVSIAAMPSTPVTGTFWPATQPISGAVSVSNFPTTQAVSGAVSVSNFPATQPVSIAAALPAGTNMIGVTGDQTDLGRILRHFFMDNYVAAPAVEALMTVTQNRDGAAVGGTTTPAVVGAGKKLRLTGGRISTKSLATAGSAVLRIRVNPAGPVTLTSPIVHTFEVGSAAAVAGLLAEQVISFPEGIDLPTGAGVGFSLAGYGPTGTLALQGVTRFEVWGYEYNA